MVSQRPAFRWGRRQKASHTPVFRAAVRLISGSAVPFAGLALVSALARTGRLGYLDEAAMTAVQNGRRPPAVTAARTVSTLAEPAFCAVLLAACAVTVARRRGCPEACVPCLVVASGTTVRRALSRLIARQRPPASVWLTEPEGFSLPSKHSTLAALTVGACARGLEAGSGAKHALPLLTAAAVGTSRVYLGVHWPTDIVAAWLFAEGWLALSESLASAFSRSRPE
ncbi:MAG: phosphatase PAP2 family protein [Streptosporangiaceae bacterium]